MRIQKQLNSLQIYIAVLVFAVHVNQAFADSLKTQNEPVISRTISVEDQHGNSLNFYQDLIKGNIVAVNFIFTNCKASCPLSSAVFQAVQKINDLSVHLITITLDPSNDDSRKLRSYAEKFQADKKWHFITGKPEQIKELLRNFDAYSPTSDLNNHTNTVLLGNDAKHKWRRLYGLPSADTIAAAINDIQ